MQMCNIAHFFVPVLVIPYGSCIPVSECAVNNVPSAEGFPLHIPHRLQQCQPVSTTAGLHMDFCKGSRGKPLKGGGL